MPSVPITMPQLGESIAEATIMRLEFSVGDFVPADQEVMEVETQKAVMTVTTPCAGKVTEWVCQIGQSYAVGEVLGYLDVTVEDAQRAGIKLEEISSEKSVAPTPAPPVDDDAAHSH